MDDIGHQGRKGNCWEYKNCGRGPQAGKNGERDVCPVAKEGRLEGVHGGRLGGRACWLVAGTFCGGAPQGSFAKKYSTCKECDFYKLVLLEEGAKFELTMNLMKRLKGKKLPKAA